jgi:tetratricopeptide (TPR) repeat protein
MKSLTVFFLLLLAAQTMRSQIAWPNVQRVYSSLITAVGDGSKIAPPIELSTSERAVAYYSPSKQTVFVEQRFLQICQSMGADSLNALAFILGHELAHFYRNHGWVHSSGMGYVDAELKADWKELSKDAVNHAKDEAEADIFAGFYALVAGYNAMGVAAKTLTTVYRAYGINDTVPGYPSLQQRIEIANNAEAKSEELYLLFKTGLYCISTSKYEVASKIYTNIYNQDYAGTEVLNNLGIAQILWGYSMTDEKPSYMYPIFVSTDSPLDSATRSTEGENLIRNGIAFVKQALDKDAKNTVFMLNLASGFAMINEFADAEYYLSKAETTSDPAIKAGCANLRGIIAMKKGDAKLAKKMWSTGKDDDPFAEMNLGQTFGKPKKEGKLSNPANAAEVSQVDAIDLGDPQLKSKLKFKVIKLPGLKISYAELPTSTIIEVYGGSAVEYRFQTFKSANFEDRNFGWKPGLTSPTTTVYVSAEYYVLKLKNSESKLPEFVKYVVQ